MNRSRRRQPVIVPTLPLGEVKVPLILDSRFRGGLGTDSLYLSRCGKGITAIVLSWGMFAACSCPTDEDTFTWVV
jgi:hypothetical protein